MKIKIQRSIKIDRIPLQPISTNDIFQTSLHELIKLYGKYNSETRHAIRNALQKTVNHFEQLEIEKQINQHFDD